MARKTPTVTGTRLTFYDEYRDQDVFVCDIVSDWQTWQDWLNDEQHKSVRFVAADKTSCSLVKEYRPFFGGEKQPVWIAHKRLGKLRKKYIGKSVNVSHAKLKAVAFELSQREIQTRDLS